MRFAPGRRRAALLLMLCLCAAAALSWRYALAVERRPASDIRIVEAAGPASPRRADDPRVAITRDGSAVVRAAERIDAAGATRETLVLRHMASAVDVPLFTAPEGAEARSPFFSSDGRQVGFIDRGRLMVVPAAGGAAQELCSCGASPAVRSLWLQDGSIIYQANHRLRRLTPDRRRRDLTRLDSAAGEREHVAPTVLADQHTIVFTTLNAGGTAALRSVHLRTGKETAVLQGGMAAQYAGNGHVAYVDDASMIRVIDLNPATLRVERVVPVTPVRVAAGRGGSVSWAVSEAGTLVHAAEPPADAAATGGQELTWVARDGRRQASGLPPGRYVMARIAPTGDAVALEVDGQTTNVWLWELSTNRLVPLTTGARNAFPEWLPDGQTLLVGSVGEGSPSINRVWRDGRRAMTRVPASLQVQGPLSISAHGTLAAFRSEWPSTHLRAMSPDGGVVTVVTSGPEREQAAALSPDGTWLAYDATLRDEAASATNVPQVFVRPFLDASAARRQISTAGGSRPLWSRDGREIFYLDASHRLMRVGVTAGNPPEFGVPAPFFEDVTATNDWFVALGRRTFDLTPDGSRFLAVTSRVEQPAAHSTDLVISTGWLQHIHWPWMQVWDYLTS